MTNLAAELQYARDGRLNLTTPILQIVLPQLERLISHFGAACTGPYHVTNGLDGQVGLRSTHRSAVQAIIAAERINTDPNDPDTAYVIPNRCTSKPCTRADRDLDQTLEHDLKPGDDPRVA